MLTEEDLFLLNEVFSKNIMLSNILPLVKRFIQSQYFTAEMLTIPMIGKVGALTTEKRNLTKPELSTICYFIFYNKEIFNAFLNAMPKWFGLLMEKLLWQKEMHRNEVEKIVGQKIIILNKSGNSYEYLPELKFFVMRDLGGYFYNWNKTWEQTYIAKPVAFYLPVVIKNIITDFYPKPEGYEITSVKTLDEIEKHTVFSAEGDILQEFSPLVSYYLQDNVKYSEKGRPNMAGLKKTQRTLALKEFYNDDDTALYPVRTMLVLGMLYGLKPKDISDNTPLTIKKIFNEHFMLNKYPSTIANFIINQIKGIGYLSDYDYAHPSAHIVWDLIKEIPANGWVTWKNLEIYLQSHFLEPQPILGHSLHKLYFENSTDKYDKIFIDNKNRIEMLQWAFVKGCIYLFAAYGMIEISYVKPNTTALGKTWFSEYDGLQAFQLTGLGRYVLGKSRTYEPPIIENAAKLIFDEENLIIRAEGNLNLMSTLLGNYVEKISANRFAFRPVLFLKDCKTVKQIENKIALFRKSLNVKLPAFWETELKQMVANASAIAEQDNFFVFKLNENDKHLLRTIAQDNQLKSITIKAERFYVLLEKKNKAAFKNRLMELGYFVEA